MLCNNIKYAICCDNYIEYNGKIWFFSFAFNALCCYNNEQRKVETMVQIPNEDIWKIRLYKEIIRVQNKIILIPCSANEIAIYDLENAAIQKVSFEYPEFAWKVKPCLVAKFWTAVSHGKNVYLFGHYYPGILKLNLENYQITYLNNWINKIDKLALDDEKPYLTEGIVENDLAILPFCCANAVLIFDFNNDSIKIKELKYSGTGFNGMCKYGDTFWLVPRQSGAIVEWDGQRIKEYEGYPEGLQLNNIPFNKPLFYENKIYLTPIRANQFIEIDIKSGKMKELSILNQIFEEKRSSFSVGQTVAMCPTIKDGILSFFCGFTYKRYFYNIGDHILEEEYIIPNSSQVERFCEAYSKEFLVKGNGQYFVKSEIRENETINLKEYIDFLKIKRKNLTNATKLEAKENDNYGNLIHEKMKVERG